MWIKNLPKPLTDWRSEILLHHARKGNTVAADMLIRGHLRLATKVANSFKTTNYAKDNDILGVALLALVENVKTIINPNKELTTDFRIAWWIQHRIRWEIRSFLRHDRLAVMHPDTYMALLASGVKNPPAVLLINRQWNIPVIQRDPLIVREALSKAILDDRDRLIVEHLGAGDNLTEIGEKLQLTRERVRQLVNQIRERLIDFQDDYPKSRRGWAQQRELA